MIGLAQLYRRDVPDLPAGPDDCDLLQVFWCPFNAHGPSRYDLELHLRWRRSWEVGDVLATPPQSSVVGSDGFVPEPCVFHPEQVVTYPFAGLLPEELCARIGAWEEALEDEAEQSAGGNTAEPPGYQYDLSIPPSWRVGGFASWHTTDPYPMDCLTCTTPMRLLMTIDSSEWDGGSGSWKPLEDQTQPAHRCATPTEVTVACVFDTRPAPRRPHDVIHPPGGRSDERRARPGPRAENKWCTASLVRPPEQVIADAFDQAEARDPKHLRPWGVLVDGARHQLDLITAETTRRDVTVHVLLDFVHVAEYVWAAAHAFHKPGATEAETWAADHLTAILAGHTARTAAEMTAQANREGLPAARREAVDPCRHLIADRLDITGARWGLPGAEAVLRLRTLVSNSDLDAYWRYHLAREHERLYPTPDQRNYSLTA